MPISLVTWNMQGGSGEKANEKMVALNKWISEGVNVICLQEATVPMGTFHHQIANGQATALVQPAQDQRTRTQNSHKYTCYYVTGR